MADDLLACQKCIVTNVVDRDLDPFGAQTPLAYLSSRAMPQLFALRRDTGLQSNVCLGGVDDPGTIAIVRGREILITFVVGNRTSNSLGARVSSDDANAFDHSAFEWLNGP